MIKIPFSKIPGFNNFAGALRGKPKLFIFIITCLAAALGFLAFLGSRETINIRKSIKTSAINKPVDSGEDKDVGVLVGAVDTKSYVSLIEKQYYDITSKADSLGQRIDALEKNINDLKKAQSEVSKIIIDLDNRMMKVNTDSIKDDVSNNQGMRLFGEPLGNTFTVKQKVKPEINLETAKLKEIKTDEKPYSKKSVYLPLGSFVKCSLLTGVYAPANESNPLPVLIRVDEAFYGPNNTRIPLKGAFAVGKAIGDIVSKRAVIQAVSFSTVLPNGEVFEHEANIGYLADKDGQLGLNGELIYNTGKQLGLNFLSGFLAGGAEALSQAETSAVTGGYGQTSRNVTGDTGRYSMFSGLARSAEGMSGYYQKQLENMVPAVKVEAGTKAILVIQKGVEIEGFEVSDDRFGYIN